MSNYHPLTERQVKQLANAYFLRNESRSTPQDRPVTVLVGGQPGAGKSGLSRLVVGEVATRGGYVRVDADRMRDLIPTPTHGPKPTSQETQADAARLVAEFRRIAVEERRNIIEEGTFRNPSGALKMVYRHQENGRDVEFLALAVAEGMSQLSIFSRHEQMHYAGHENPRLDSLEYHYYAMDGFESTVAKLADKVDRLRVVNRDGETFFDSNSAKNRSGNPLEAMAGGHDFNDAGISAARRALTHVTDQAEVREAGASYLASLKYVGQQIFHNAYLPRADDFAVANLDRNIKTLAADSRFDALAGPELEKAAYWRGYSEIGKTLDGFQQNLDVFDAQINTRSALEKLPDPVALVDRPGIRPETTRQKPDDGYLL